MAESYATRDLKLQDDSAHGVAYRPGQAFRCNHEAQLRATGDTDQLGRVSATQAQAGHGAQCRVVFVQSLAESDALHGQLIADDCTKQESCVEAPACALQRQAQVAKPSCN